jgi:hypothetical protein
MIQRKDLRPRKTLQLSSRPLCLEVCGPLVDPSIGTSVKLHATDLVALAGLVRAYTLTSATLRAIPEVTSREVRCGARK